MSYATGARGWILWPGVAIMVADALTGLAMSGPTILRTFTRGAQDDDGVPLEDPNEAIPSAWWMGGLAVATCLTVYSTWRLFEIPPYMSVLAVALSSVLSAIAVRSMGETDINPTGGMGKVTQLVFGGIAPGNIQTNLMSAAIASAGASQSADMMTDLKTGYLLGASPRKQLVAQLAGVTVGIIVCVPIYIAFANNYELGGEDYPAPAAFAWKAMAEVLTQGLDALPQHAIAAVIAGLIFGSAVPLARKFLGWTWLPSGLAMGVAFIVPAYYSVAMFIGGMIFLAWKRADPVNAEGLGFAVASGLLAGEGLMGVVLIIGTELTRLLGL
jgi:OPT family oligopeptide transporter